MVKVGKVQLKDGPRPAPDVTLAEAAGLLAGQLDEAICLLRAIRLEIRAGAESGPGKSQEALRAESDELAGEGGTDHE